MLDKQKIYHYLLLLSILLTVGYGCTNDEMASQSNNLLAVSLRSINTNNEDRVTTVRMIIAESGSGKVVYNGFPEWASNDYSQLSTPIEVEKKGTFDFYFFANENDPLITDTQRTRLKNLQNVAQLFPQEHIGFSSDFSSSSSLFPMTAVYKNIAVIGGAYDNPQVIEVFLIRNFAKVEVKINRNIESPTADPNHAVIKRIYLQNLASEYITLFNKKPHAQEGLAVETTVPSRDIVSAGTSIDYTKNGEIFRDSIYISELLRFHTDPSGTKVVIEYVPTKESTDSKKYELELDIQYIDGLEKIIHNLGTVMTPEDMNSFSTQSILRNMHYIVNVNIDDARLEPTVRLEVQPWKLVTQDYEAKDDYLNASKESVTMNYLNGDVNSLMILTNITDGRAFSYTVTPQEPTDASWFSISPAQPLNGNQTFSVRALSENMGSTPKTAIVTFHAENYAHDVSVRIIQLPRQDIATRKYVNFIGTGGSITIPIDNYGYDWRADVVENYSTVAGTPDWLTVTKNGDNLELNVKSTNDVDLLRYAVVKVYDGSERAAYIWVEQGNYKPVEVNGWTLLDRNLGALSAPTSRTAWSDASPITNQERVKRNGFYYQWGRVPDGYHWQGIDVVKGNISFELTNDMRSSIAVDYVTRPQAAPLKWWDPVTSGSQDPQYGKFISTDPWLSNASPFPRLWSFPKKMGVDPCPEGYRVPDADELKSILTGTQFQKSSQGFWVAKTGGGDVYFPRAQFRDHYGILWEWLNDASLQPTYYATSNLNNTANTVSLVYLTPGYSPAQFERPVSYGMVVRCIKE